MELTRRNFVQGAAAGLAGLASLAAVGCSPAAKKSDEAAASDEKGAKSGVDYASKVTETKDCDIVVIGGGMSGLTAAVEALNGGANVVLLESQAQTGGNGSTTSCVMGVGTDMQKALNINLTPAQIISAEMETFNSSVDGSRWSELVRNSADNIEWLIEQGALFNGKVDNYNGAGVVDTGHWWTGDTGRDGKTGFVEPMTARVEELGGEIVYNAEGKQLIMENGEAKGVYAELENGVLQVNAKAVIIATGGYANNNDMLAEKGYNTDEVFVFGIEGHNGDGISMAIEAGAKSWMQKSSLMEYPMCPTLGKPSVAFARLATAIWVNGNGVRFADENCGAKVPARPALAVRAQDASYSLFNQAMFDAVSAKAADSGEEIQKGVQSGDVFKADTIAELAKAAGIDADALTATVEQYNAYCAAGSDDEFAKDAKCLVALDQGPYYLMANNGIYFLTTIGGIDTTEKAEVRAEEGGVIKGLYAVGVDGVELYNGLYTIDIPGSCNANNINSGRTAAKQALALV